MPAAQTGTRPAPAGWAASGPATRSAPPPHPHPPPLLRSLFWHRPTTRPAAELAPSGQRPLQSHHPPPRHPPAPPRRCATEPAGPRPWQGRRRWRGRQAARGAGARAHTTLAAGAAASPATCAHVRVWAWFVLVSCHVPLWCATVHRICVAQLRGPSGTLQAQQTLPCPPQAHLHAAARSVSANPACTHGRGGATQGGGVMGPPAPLPVDPAPLAPPTGGCRENEGGVR